MNQALTSSVVSDKCKIIPINQMPIAHNKKEEINTSKSFLYFTAIRHEDFGLNKQQNLHFQSYPISYYVTYDFNTVDSKVMVTG